MNSISRCQLSRLLWARLDTLVEMKFPSCLSPCGEISFSTTPLACNLQRELKTEVASWTQNLLGTKSALKKLVTSIRIPAEGTWRLTANWVCSWPCSSRHWNNPGKTEPATGVRRPWLLFWLKLLGWSPESKCLWGMTSFPGLPYGRFPPLQCTLHFPFPYLS